MVMLDLLDWAEQAGLENLKTHNEVSTVLQKQGVTTLTILLAGATGGLAYAIQGFNYGICWLTTGSIAFSVYLYVLSAVLVYKTLTVVDYPAIHNEPINLYQKEYELEELREAELANIQERINQAAQLNRCSSNWLNKIRYAAILSPMIFLVTAWMVVV